MEKSGSDEELSMDELSLEIDTPPSKDDLEDWRKTLNKVVPAVVVIRATACRTFDTDSARAYSATGFVVDKRRGIILTNRHVVKTGPVVAESMFVNREEIPVYPIYRDPVHDFGFFRYDPSAIQFLSYEEIPLAPEAAHVGLEIRIVGNDSGEKVSILAGTLARLDREAPVYRKDGYNDFNTFYLQAASGTKGGSSGSPVIDRKGRAVALNAGGRTTTSASAFFLPLERVVRALKFLQIGSVTIPRGELQLVRNASPPGETGMLVVDSVVPNGPAHKILESGDVLVRLNGEVTTQFLKTETLFDDSVNHNVEFQIERGGKPMIVDLKVQDLHSITPDYFLEISGAVIHPLSYQQARNFCFPCGLVYVAEQGYMLSRAGIPRHAIIKKFAGTDISKLEDLISVLSKFCRGERVPLEYTYYKDRHRVKSALVTVDRHDWYAPPQIYTRDDSSGLWTIKPVLPPESPMLSHQCVGQEPIGSLTSTKTTYEKVSEGHHALDESIIEATMQSDDISVDGVLLNDLSLDEPGKDLLEDSGEEVGTVSRDYQGTTTNASVAEHVVDSLVMVEVHIPLSCMLDGVHLTSFSGTGVIIYHSISIGLLAVDRNTVPISVSDVMLSFAACPIEIPGEVVFLHPTHNFAIVSYAPSALGDDASMVRSAELLPEPALHSGDPVYLVGLSRSLRATSRKSFVTNPCASFAVGSAKSPRYKATNIEVIVLDTDFGNKFSGVLTDELGRVQAIWGSFSTQVQLKNNKSQDQEFVKRHSNMYHKPDS